MRRPSASNPYVGTVAKTYRQVLYKTKCRSSGEWLGFVACRMRCSGRTVRACRRRAAARSGRKTRVSVAGFPRRATGERAKGARETESECPPRCSATDDDALSNRSAWNDNRVELLRRRAADLLSERVDEVNTEQQRIWHGVEMEVAHLVANSTIRRIRRKADRRRRSTTSACALL